MVAEIGTYLYNNLAGDIYNTRLLIAVLRFNYLIKLYSRYLLTPGELIISLLLI